MYLLVTVATVEKYEDSTAGSEDFLRKASIYFTSIHASCIWQRLIRVCQVDFTSILKFINITIIFIINFHVAGSMDSKNQSYLLYFDFFLKIYPSFHTCLHLSAAARNLFTLNWRIIPRIL